MGFPTIRTGHLTPMKRLLLFVTTAAVATAYATRNELRRYLRIRRMNTDPTLVGESVTAQGNRKSAGRH